MKKGILWVLNGLLFCGFLSVVFLAIQKADEEEYRASQEQNREELVQILSNVGKQSHPVSRYQDLVERLVRALRWGELPQTILEPFQNSGMEIFLFDVHGGRVLKEGFAKHKIGVSERFLNVLKAVAVNPSFRMAPREMTFASAFAGNSAAIPMLAVRPGQIHDLRTIGIQKLAGWFPVEFNRKKVGDVLAWISPDGITPEHMAASAVEKIQRKVSGRMRFGWISLLEPGKGGDGFGKKLSARFREKLAKNHFQTVFSSGSHWIAIYDLESHIRLFGYRPFSSPLKFYILLKSIIFCCGGVGFLVTVWLAVWGSNLPLRVSSKLGALFCLMGFTGIFILLFMAHAYRQSEEKALIRENRKTSLDILRKVDGNFLATFRPDLEFYKKLIREVEKRPDSYPETFLKLKERILNGPIHSAYYMNETRKMVFRIPLQSWDSAGMAAGVQENFANGNCLEILNRFNNKTSSISGGLREISEIAKETAALDVFIKNLGNFLSFSVVDESVTFFQSPILASAGHALGVIMIGHDTRNMEAFHTQRMAKLIQKGSRYRLMGIPRTTDVRLRIIPHPAILKEDLIRRMQEELKQTGMTSQRLGVFNRKKVLVCAIPGMNLQDYNLFLLSSFKPIAREVQRILTLFYAAAFFLFLITLQVIFLISEVLLVPVKEISLGIEFLKKMEFGHRIQLQTGDEMEHICKGINEALEGMDDLAVSRTIQEHLFPAASLVTPEVCLHGWKKTVSPTGSLFFDGMMLADNRAAFLIRKTAGTGVDSALTLAMDRTILRLLLEDPGIQPAEVIRGWKEFQDLAEEKGEDTPLIVGILDLSSGLLVGDGMGTWQVILVEGMRARDFRGTGLLTWELGDENGSPCGFSLRLDKGHGLLLLCAETWQRIGLAGKEAPSPEFWDVIHASLRSESVDIGTALFSRSEKQSAGVDSQKDQVLIFLQRLTGEEA